MTMNGKWTESTESDLSDENDFLYADFLSG